MRSLLLARFILILATLAVLTGTALRFTALDSKVYWHDEAHTALRVSGNTTPEYVDSAFTNRVLTRDELRAWQHPRADQGYADTLHALMTRPEHGPLYYLLARLGFYFTDDARLATRTVAALLSLLLFPAAVWLWRELFPQAEWQQGAWLLVGLFALSPFQLIYAQEARQYSLWAVLTVAVCAALLRARRRDDPTAWAGYALLAAIGLYTHLMLAVVLAVQMIWLLWERRRGAPVVPRHMSLALVGTLLLFLPWLLLFFNGLEEVGHVTEWMRIPVPLEQLVNAWGLHLTHLFVDGATAQHWMLPALVLALYAVYATARHAPVPARRLLLLLLVATLAVVIGPDLLRGGRRSQEARYLLPALLILQVMLAFALTRLLATPGKLRGRFALTIWSLLLALGLWSDISIVQAEYWWNKSMSSYNNEVARLIDAGDDALVVCQHGDINPGEVLSLSYATAADTRYLLLRDDYVPDRSELSGSVFLLNPSENLRERLSTYGRVERLHAGGRLWRLYSSD